MFWEDVLSRNMMFQEHNDQLLENKAETAKQLKAATLRIAKFDEEHKEGVDRQ